MKLYAAMTVLTLLVTAAFYAVGDFSSALAALSWLVEMLLLFAAGDVAVWALRRRWFALTAVAGAGAVAIVVHRFDEATEPAFTAIGLPLIFGSGMALSLLLRDTRPADPAR